VWLPVALATLLSVAGGADAVFAGATAERPRLAARRTAPPKAFLGAFNGPALSPYMQQLKPAGLVALLHKLPKVDIPKFEKPKFTLQGRCNFAAGGIAGAVASAITCPLEVIKTNLQARANVGSGLHPLSMATKIVAEQGPRGLYRGLSLSLMGIIPTRSCYFWTYGASKGALIGVFGDCPVTHMLSAVTAGALSATVTCPLWMVKTRMQLTGASLVDTTRSIVAEKGVKGMYRGLKASYWGLSEGALQLLLYEKVKRYIKETNDGQELSTWQYLVAAGGTKGLASLATYPHEVVRTRMRESASSRYQSMIQSIALIAKEEGRKGLYSGLGPHLLRVVPNTAIMFMSFEVLSRHLPSIIEERAWEPHMAVAHERVAALRQGAAARMARLHHDMRLAGLERPALI
jgi:solute carrier family 25 protein 33/36